MRVTLDLADLGQRAAAALQVLHERRLIASPWLPGMMIDGGMAEGDFGTRYIPRQTLILSPAWDRWEDGRKGVLLEGGSCWVETGALYLGHAPTVLALLPLLEEALGVRGCWVEWQRLSERTARWMVRTNGHTGRLMDRWGVLLFGTGWGPTREEALVMALEQVAKRAGRLKRGKA